MQVTKKPRENTSSLIRRFTQKIRESGILINVKKSRFYDKGLSRNRRRKNTLEGVEARKERMKLRKMGKL